MASDTMRIMGGVPLELFLRHEQQCLRNHRQSARTLASRGGLSPCEMAAILQDRPYRRMSAAVALAIVVQHLLPYEEAQAATHPQGGPDRGEARREGGA